MALTRSATEESACARAALVVHRVRSDRCFDRYFALVPTACFIFIVDLDGWQLQLVQRDVW